MINLLIENWQLLLALLGVISTPVAWVFGGKAQARAELKKARIEATLSMQEMYDDFAIDYKERYEEKKGKIESMKIEISDLEVKNKKLEKSVNFLEKKYNTLIKSNKNKL